MTVMGNRRDYLINAIVEVCQRIYTKGWVANHDGNVTVRYEDLLLATPTAVSKGDIVPELILALDMEGNKLQGIGKPFSEIKLHLAAYRAREDIRAVVHAHPPYSMARGMVGGDFEINVPEAVVSIGGVIPVVGYVMPGAKENDELVADALGKVDVFMMAGNGVLAVGSDVKEAFLRMELLEHLLKIDNYTRTMGTAMRLPGEDREKLLEKRASIGLGPKTIKTPPPSGTIPTVNMADETRQDILKGLIAEEIRKVLKEGS